MVQIHAQGANSQGLRPPRPQAVVEGGVGGGRREDGGGGGRRRGVDARIVDGRIIVDGVVAGAGPRTVGRVDLFLDVRARGGARGGEIERDPIDRDREPRDEDGDDRLNRVEAERGVDGL